MVDTRDRKLAPESVVRGRMIQRLLACLGSLAALVWHYGEVSAHQRLVRRYRHRYDVHRTFRFMPRSSVHGPGTVTLGADSYLNEQSHLKAGRDTNLTIGHHCRIGPHVRIETSSAEPDADSSIEPVPTRSADVFVGDFVWIGGGSYVGPGITIGDNAIVGANSVVTKDVEPYEIVGGVPARHIRYKATIPPPP